MDNPIEDRSESPMMDGKFRPRVHVFGPFEQMVRLGGVDLQESFFSWSESRKRGATGRAVISSILFIFVLIIFFAKFFFIMKIEANAFTVEWAESNIEMGVFLFGIAAAICLGIWTHQQYFRVFHEKLDSLEEGPVRSDESFSATHVRAFIFSLLCLAEILAHSGRDFIWVREANGTVGELTLNFSNFWGAEPLVRGLVGLLCCISLAIYVLSIHAVGRKLITFNKDLIEASEMGKLGDLPTLTTYSTRQQEVLSVIKYVHGNVGKLSSFGLLGGIFMQVNGLFLLMGHRGELSSAFLWLNVGYMVIGGGIMAFILLVPQKLQIEIAKAPSVLLYDQQIWSQKDEKLTTLALSMVKRAESDDVKITVLQMFLLDQRVPHRLMMIVPLFGNAMLGLERLLPPKLS